MPAVLWTALIAWFSAEAWSAAGTGFLVPFLASLVPWAAPEQVKAGVWVIRKCAHFVEYAVLAGRGAAIDRLIGGLLWIAALGGAAMLAINWVAAAPAPWLWPSIPVAWIALFLWRRRPARA